jgi:hypothetical protein
MNVQINVLAVIVAAVAAFVVGGVWYTVLGKAWMQAIGKSREELQGNGMPGYIGAAVASLVMALVLALFIANLPPGGVVEGVVAGVLAAVGFVATAMLADVLFAGRGLRLFVINAGHQLVALGVAGAILGAWR